MPQNIISKRQDLMRRESVHITGLDTPFVLYGTKANERKKGKKQTKLAAWIRVHVCVCTCAAACLRGNVCLVCHVGQ